MVGKRQLLAGGEVEQPNFMVAGAIGMISELLPIR
jgi:hypothetical protein